MILLWALIGLSLPTVVGYQLIGLLEGRTRVLGAIERLGLAFLLGLTFTMFVIFLLQIAKLSLFTRVDVILVHILLVAVLGLMLILTRRRMERASSAQHASPPTESLSHSPSRVVWAFLILLSLWTTFKIIVGGSILLTTPPYFDDTLKNWNLRGKVFYQHFAFTLAMDPTHPDAVGTLSAYPPTVSMTKAMLATFAGKWDEHLVNSPHLLWFLALLMIVYGMLYRWASRRWAVFGVYVLVSMPLVLFHGVNAYAEIFLAGHLFAAVGLFVSGMAEENPERRAAFLRLSAFATALLVLTKNEAILLHVPMLVATILGSLWLAKRYQRMTMPEVRRTLVWYVSFFLCIVLPWLIFKWANGLSFGNAKEVSTGYSFGWQPYVTQALVINTFFEGNWHLLFPLFFLLILWLHRHAFARPFAPLITFILLILGLEVGLFLFSSLAIEAILQTGSARGFLQVVPLVTVATVLLAREGMDEL